MNYERVVMIGFTQAAIDMPDSQMCGVAGKAIQVGNLHHHVTQTRGP